LFRILLVEDVAAERELLREALERRGAQVTEAADDKDAYAVLNAANHAEFDLLLTDINLGLGTTGFDVARAARQVFPDLPVVYMTGYDIETERHALPGSLCLRKPNYLAELADEVLDFVAARRRRNVATAAQDDRDDDALRA
jgi:CheY-like chemotaxis protein